MPQENQDDLDAGTTLREKREAVGLSVSDMAGRLGVPPLVYVTWEYLFTPEVQHAYKASIDRILSEALERVLRESYATPPARRRVAQAEREFRVALGQRAKARRIQLGLSRSDMAALAGVTPARLLGWECRLPSTIQGNLQGAWEAALQVPRGWVRDPDMPAADPVPALPTRVAAPLLDLSSAGLASVAEEIREVGVRLASVRRSRRRASSRAVANQSKCAAIFAARYLASGDRKPTLKAIGREFGVTQERVRQVLAKLLRLAQSTQITLPVLASLRSALSAAPPRTTADAEAAHSKLLGGISLRAADTFSRDILGIGLVHIPEDLEGVAAASRKAALRMVRSCGAAHLAFVAGAAGAELGRPLAVNDVMPGLETLKGLEWLQGLWFWLGPDMAHNRVLEVTKKVLTAARCRVSVEDIQQALGRSRRPFYESSRRYQRPLELELPLEVLCDLLRRVPWISVVQSDTFALAAAVDEEAVLGGGELAVVHAIREHGGAVARHQLVETGALSLPNLSDVLGRSPVTKRLYPGVYGVRGTEVPPDAYARAVESAKACAGRAPPAAASSGELTDPRD